MAEHRFTCTLRVYEAEKALRLIAAVGKAGHPAGVPVYFSESVILGGGGLICWHWPEPYHPAQFFLYSSWRLVLAIHPQRSDDSLFLHEEPWLFLMIEKCSKRFPFQLAELLQTSLPTPSGWFLRGKSEQGRVCVFLFPRLHAEETSYFQPESIQRGVL